MSHDVVPSCPFFELLTFGCGVLPYGAFSFLFCSAVDMFAFEFDMEGELVDGCKCHRPHMLPGAITERGKRTAIDQLIHAMCNKTVCAFTDVHYLNAKK